jgi:hypothetical protein
MDEVRENLRRRPLCCTSKDKKLLPESTTISSLSEKVIFVFSFGIVFPDGIRRLIQVPDGYTIGELRNRLTPMHFLCDPDGIRYPDDWTMDNLSPCDLHALPRIVNGGRATREIEVIFSLAPGDSVRLTHKENETIVDLINNIQEYADDKRPLCLTLPEQREVPLPESMLLVDLSGNTVYAYFFRIVFDDAGYFVQSTHGEKVDGFRKRLTPGDFICNSNRECYQDDIYMNHIPSGVLYVKPDKQITVKYLDDISVRITPQSTAASLLEDLKRMGRPAFALLDISAGSLLNGGQSLAGLVEVEALEFQLNTNLSFGGLTPRRRILEVIATSALEVTGINGNQILFTPLEGDIEYLVGLDQDLSELPAGTFHFEGSDTYSWLCRNPGQLRYWNFSRVRE